MTKSILLRYMIFSVLVSTIISCAHYPHIRPITQKRSPSQIINNFKYESQAKELDAVISEKNDDKPEFLKKVNNRKVDMWIKYFTGKGKARFERYLQNGEKYRPVIESTFDDYGLPQGLYFVGLIESGYYLKAKSHANAVGPWQFIKETGKRYGLTIRRGVDERQSIVKATKAAALFFQDLYNIFGSWELALSAYNAGEYGVIRRIRKANTRDYYELSRQKKLPKETRHYVPKILAAMNVYENAKKYGINIPVYKSNIYENLKEVNLNKSLSIKTISKKTNISIKTIQELNPDLKWAHTPIIKQGYTLILPKNNFAIKKLIQYEKVAKNTVRKSTRNSKFQKADYLLHKVKRGENLYTLARQNHTSISKILQLNGFKKRTIYIGQVIKLPQADVNTYTVKHGDYLLKIAKKHGLTISKLKKINDMKTSKIYPGQRLIVSFNK